MNNGLLPVECDTSAIGEGDRLVITVDAGLVSVTNSTRAVGYDANPIPPMMTSILDAGGLVDFVRRGAWTRDGR